MTVCRVENPKKQVCTELNQSTANDLANEVRENKLDCKNEFQTKIDKAIESNNLYYNCETGFHYMKQ